MRNEVADKKIKGSERDREVDRNIDRERERESKINTERKEKTSQLIITHLLAAPQLAGLDDAGWHQHDPPPIVLILQGGVHQLLIRLAVKERVTHRQLHARHDVVLDQAAQGLAGQRAVLGL